MLITIIIAIVFLFLLGQAILETIWGVCLIICGLACYVYAYFLQALAFLIRGFKKIIGLFRKPKPAPRKFSVAQSIIMYNKSLK